jgi:chemotaxis protein methyltransferase CheR
MGVTLSINELRNVTNEMARYGHMDYTGYSFSFLKRRLWHVFSELRVRKLNHFLERLSDETFREGVKYHMAVNVTEMFRDPGFWRSLRSAVFPLFGEQKWSAWFPDVPSGEELFSLAILLEEDGLLDQVDIFCQHPSKEKCRVISEGFVDSKNNELNHSNYRRLEENDRFDHYFCDDDGQLRFQKDLLDGCRFESSWLEHGDENDAFDLIMFRNAGINYSFQKRDEVLKSVVERLNPGGILTLGVKELIPGFFHGTLMPLNEKESIYRKTGVKSS